MQGYDGVDLEMNFNGSKFVSHNDEFSDVVCFFWQLISLIGPYYLKKPYAVC